MKLDDSQPIYLQIADQIRQQVIEGHLTEGEQLMSTNQYAQALRINPATAAKAFNELTTTGIIYKKRGIGMFVAEGARERLLQERRGDYFEQVLRPALEEGRRIGIGQGAISDYLSAFMKEQGDGQ